MFLFFFRISLVSVLVFLSQIISNFTNLCLFVFILVNLSTNLPILLIFSKNHLIVLLIICRSFSTPLISVLILIISFHLLFGHH